MIWKDAKNPSANIVFDIVVILRANEVNENETVTFYCCAI